MKEPKEMLSRGKGEFINCTDYDDAIKAMEEYAQQFKSQLEAKDKEIEELKSVSEICPSCQDDESKMPCQLCDNMGRILLKEFIYAKDDFKALKRTHDEVYAPRIKELESQLHEANAKVQTEVKGFSEWVNSEGYGHYADDIWRIGIQGEEFTFPDLLKKYEKHKALKK